MTEQTQADRWCDRKLHAQCDCSEKCESPRTPQTFDSYVRGFLAQRAGVAADEIEFFSFEASPSREWSEYTAEDFSCFVKLYLVDDGEASVYLDEEAVCSFLNGFPVAK